MARREFSHFTSADEHDSSALERVENLLSKFDGHVTDRHRVRRNSGFVSDSLGHAKRVMDQPVQDSTRRSRFDRERVRVTHLSEHLRLAYDHRIERRRHAEQVPNRVFIRVPIKMLIEETRRQMAGRVEEVLELSRSKFQLLSRSRAENLHAITSRNDQTLAHDLAVDETAQTVRARRVVEGESFADLYRSCFVIDSDEKYGHLLNQA